MNNTYYNMIGSISGSDTCINEQDTTVITYQLNFNKGWNTLAVVTVYSSFTKVSWLVTSQETSGGKWYFRGVTSLEK